MIAFTVLSLVEATEQPFTCFNKNLALLLLLLLLLWTPVGRNVLQSKLQLC
jgi:hypothetical protein